MIRKIESFKEYEQTYKYSIEDPEGFWGGIAENFFWRKKWDRVLDWEFKTPEVKWFVNGKLNITENCLDRHLKERGNQIALIWEPNDPNGEVRKITYLQLHQEVCRCANALRGLGIQKGDRICIYMPMVPELVIAILASARIGAIHSVVFAGFSALSLADRIKDASCKVVICSDYNARGNKNIPVKEIVDKAIDMGCETIESILVYKNTGDDVNWVGGRDHWWHDLVSRQHEQFEAIEMDAEDALFILYTSGSTARPKGVVHTCGGYMVYTCYTFTNVFRYEPGDIYWCTADVGWITGHSYIIYGPLLAGATSVMFEGIPTWPDPGRFWQICEKHRVTQFYTAPTAIRSLMAFGNEWPHSFDLTSIKVLGTVGEPINEEAWHWYQDHVGKGITPIADTWWQTETGGIMISSIPGVNDIKPCYAAHPLPGIQPVILDAEGNPVTDSEVEGLLCIVYPWPSIIRTLYGDHPRCKAVYFSAFKDAYFTGDAAKMDKDGRFRIIGRVDDVINVSGHRIGTAEIENALDEHHLIIEAAVVGFPHPVKGQGIYAYVVLQNQENQEIDFEMEAKKVVSEMIGPIARPDIIQIVSGLPKTRSGKIMRRILRKIAAGETDSLGDISTLLNPEILDEIIQGAPRLG
ncbi:MAG TPA: acetate--CoA ligase [Saprospiraceae bacterium]|nr:acetate--CoA ligase [Saprospiraceae bacterium]